MAGSYRLITDHDDDALPASGDILYLLLDALAETDTATATIRCDQMAERFVQVVANRAGSLQLRFRQWPGEPIQEVDAVDVLAAFRSVMAAVRDGDQDWAPIFAPVEGTFGRDPGPVDYARTGLPIATAMLDAVKRRKRLGLPPWPAMPIRWGSGEVLTGDVWAGLPAAGRVVVRAIRVDHRHRHGLAVAVSEGSVALEGEAPSREALVWPERVGEEIVLTYRSPHRILRLCNVYVERAGGGREIVARWEEQAGMRVEVAADRRVYRCNHPRTDPPTFEDLVCQVRVVAA
ncbi:hypothetical protein ABZ744_20970 [Micromonospora chersina]|uniref:hypothetical protein n=1 Tax=Micromonospora chersina TaxID=47854 RepID=UPI0033FB804C